MPQKKVHNHGINFPRKNIWEKTKPIKKHHTKKTKHTISQTKKQIAMRAARSAKLAKIARINLFVDVCFFSRSARWGCQGFEKGAISLLFLLFVLLLLLLLVYSFASLFWLWAPTGCYIANLDAVGHAWTPTISQTPDAMEHAWARTPSQTPVAMRHAGPEHLANIVKKYALLKVDGSESWVAPSMLNAKCGG